MDRLQSTTQLRDGTSQGEGYFSSDRELRETEARVREQEAHVLRLIVQGAPTQMAEDLLRRLIATAEAMRHLRRPVPR